MFRPKKVHLVQQQPGSHNDSWEAREATQAAEHEGAPFPLWHVSSIGYAGTGRDCPYPWRPHSKRIAAAEECCSIRPRRPASPSHSFSSPALQPTRRSGDSASLVLVGDTLPLGPCSQRVMVPRRPPRPPVGAPCLAGGIQSDWQGLSVQEGVQGQAGAFPSSPSPRAFHW